MQIHALAVDYDGTLAHDGLVSEPTLKAIEKLISTGRRIILVTGRRLQPLIDLMPELHLFSLVVAENGALVYDPKSKQQTLLCNSVPTEFPQRLADLGVNRLELGEAIVATWRPFEKECLEIIQELALDLQIIFNKDAVMVLPSGMNKAVGLTAALERLGISILNTVAVGDAENDLAMLKLAGISVAVANALDSVKSASDLVLKEARGDGVRELIEQIIGDDLQSQSPFPKHRLQIGLQADGESLTIPLLGQRILVTGGSGGGKSKFGMRFLEELDKLGAQCVILDPEGDYQNINNAYVLGTGNRAPELEELTRVMDKTTGHFVVNLFRIPKAERPYYFDQLIHKLATLRNEKGRPHWIIADEAHYVAPREWQPAANWSDQQLTGLLFISAFPEKLSPAVFKSVNSLISVADDPQDALDVCQKLIGKCTDESGSEVEMTVPKDEQNWALLWRHGESKPVWFRRLDALTDSQRHQHSYYDGEMDPEFCFVFRGPKGELNLMVQNLRLFIQIGEGVDDATWNYHLHAHHYAQWFSDVIKSDELTSEAERVESDESLSPQESRAAIFSKIRKIFEVA